MPVGRQGGHGNLPGDFDIIDNLPAAAKTRLHSLRLRRDDARGALRTVLDAVAEQREQKLDAEAALRRYQHLLRDTRPPNMGGPQVYLEDEETAKLSAAERENAKLTWISPDDGSQVAELKNKIARAFIEMKRLAAAEAERAATFNGRGQLVREIETYLSGISAGRSLTALAEPAPTLRKGANILDEIESRRRRRRELAADLHATRSAPILAATAKQRAREKIEMLAARGEPSIARLMFGGELELPMLPMTAVPVLNDAGILIAWQQFDAEGFSAWALKDIVLKKLDAMIASEDDGSALSDEARARRESEILRDTLAVEREECALIEQAHNLGMANIEFSADCSPLALLNLELVTPSSGVLDRMLAAVGGR